MAAPALHPQHYRQPLSSETDSDDNAPTNPIESLVRQFSSTSLATTEEHMYSSNNQLHIADDVDAGYDADVGYDRCRSQPVGETNAFHLMLYVLHPQRYYYDGYDTPHHSDNFTSWLRNGSTLQQIEAIIVDLEKRPYNHLHFTTQWIDTTTGEHPTAGTLITPDNLGNELYSPINPDVMEYITGYLDLLIANTNLLGILLEDPHCIADEPDAHITPLIKNVFTDWEELAPGVNIVNYCITNTHPYTAQYSIFSNLNPELNDDALIMTAGHYYDMITRHLSQSPRHLLLITGEMITYTMHDTLNVFLQNMAPELFKQIFIICPELTEIEYDQLTELGIKIIRDPSILQLIMQPHFMDQLEYIIRELSEWYFIEEDDWDESKLPRVGDINPFQAFNPTQLMDFAHFFSYYYGTQLILEYMRSVYEITVDINMTKIATIVDAYAESLIAMVQQALI